MSAFNIKSVVIRDREASPPLHNNATLAKGVLHEALQVENTSNAGSDIGAAGTQIRLVSVPSNARLSRLEYSRADLGTSSLDIAVWYPDQLAQGGENSLSASLESTLVSSSAFATAISGDTAVAWTDAMGANTTPSLAQRTQPLWQLLGLTADPACDLDLGFSVRTANATNGYVGLRAQYVV